MPEIKEFKGLFYHRMPRLDKTAPLLHRSITREVTGELRQGPCLIIRLWPSTMAFAIGRWTGLSPHDEDTTLLIALQSCKGRLQLDEPSWCEVCGREACNCDRLPKDPHEAARELVREKIAELARDPDDERYLADVMGLLE